MSFLRRLLDPAFRRARAAEAAGDYRLAAQQYVEADAPNEAAKALLMHAVHAKSLDEKLLAYEAALRWLPPASARAKQVEGRMGTAILEDARRRGLPDAAARARLRDGARHLERARQPGEAATAWELLGEIDEAARCLVDAGDVERLEALLGDRQRDEGRRAEIRRHVDDYEVHLASGARRDAERALVAAARIAPEDPAVRDALERLQGRWVDGGAATLELSVAGAASRVTLVGVLPAMLGRAGADIGLRGPSVSREHARVDWDADAGAFTVADAESRNGTLVGGVPLGGTLTIEGALELGLGADVSVRVSPVGGPPALALDVEVVRGPDRGARHRVLAPGAETRVGDLPLRIGWPSGGLPRIEPDPGMALRLGSRRIRTPVELLSGDLIEVVPDGVDEPLGRVRVVAP